MNMRRAELARISTQKALHVRVRARVGGAQAVCIYDVAEYLGVEVRMVELPKLEGVYIRTEAPHILLSSLRPAGRQAYTCAHELGHHVFGHGHCVDELLPDRMPNAPFDPEEFQADCFAGMVLMPPTALTHAFRSRGWEPKACRPEQAFIVAGWFGVGYTTIISHMCYALGVLPEHVAKVLLRHKPKQIRSALLRDDCDDDLFVVDHLWAGRAIDVQTGDRILLPPTVAYEGTCLMLDREDEHRLVLRGVRAGSERLMARDGSWSAVVRIAKRGFVGRPALGG